MVEAYNQCKNALKEGEALIHANYSYHLAFILRLFDRNLLKRPAAVVSESSDHSRIAAVTYIDFVIKEVDRHINLTKIITWNDGCAAQFRSRFVVKLLSNYRRDLQIEWSYNEAHHGKGPMDGIGGTIKNVVFRQAKSRRVISVAANKFVPLIAALFQKEKDFLRKPGDINQSPSIPATLQTHKSVRLSIAKGGTIIDFYFLSNGKEPCHTQSFSERKCGHRERKYESLALFRLLCAEFMKKYLEENEAEDWLKYPMYQSASNCSHYVI